MARLLSTLLVLALLGGTAAAFAVTEGLKLEKSPILGPHIDKVFSPVCNCSTGRAHIEFRLRKSDRLTVTVVDSSGSVARTLAMSQRFRRGPARFTWDGRNDAGQIVPQGRYKPRVHLAGQHRTIVLPNPIRVDTTPPHVTLISVHPAVFSPDGDFRRDRVVVRYRVSEPAVPILFVDGARRARPRGHRLTGEVRWFGRYAGHAYRKGTYRITLRAVDLAGNVSGKSRSALVRIRYIELARHLIRAKAGTRFGVRVSTDSKAYRWRLGKRQGVAHRRYLILRAPRQPGRYGLFVSEHGHADRAVLVVRPGT